MIPTATIPPINLIGMPKVDSVRALPNVDGEKHARDILARVAAQVEPIMARRAHLNWRCNELREFFPDNANLLGMNVNRGAKSESRRAWW